MYKRQIPKGADGQFFVGIIESGQEAHLDRRRKRSIQIGSTGKKNSSNLEENELNYLLEKFSKDNSVANLAEFLNSAKAAKEEPKPTEKMCIRDRSTPSRSLTGVSCGASRIVPTTT